MKTNDQANTQAQVDLAIRTGRGIGAQKDHERIASENLLRNELKEREHTHVPSRDTALRNEVEELQQQVAALKKENAGLKHGLTEREAHTLEWMHGNEVFKRLALKFGKKANMSDEEMGQAMNEEAVNLAEEDPRFENTKFGQKAKERLKAKSGK